MENFLREAKKYIPNLAGIKFSSKDLVDMIGCVFQDNMNVVFGCDEVHVNYFRLSDNVA